MHIRAHPSSPDRAATRPAFAALDLGTNNCRLLIAAPTASGFRVLDSFSRVVRLGEGLCQSGQLSTDGMQRAMAALETCADRLARRPRTRLRAIATEACRRAANAPAFLTAVQQQTGLHLNIISPREEAELALESCAPLLRQDGRRALLFDIGGGSTELVWVRVADSGPPVLSGTISLPIGVVGLAERYGEAMFTPEGFEQMVGELVNRLTEFDQVHCIGREIARGGVSQLGTSGTVTTLASVVLGLGSYQRSQVDGQVLRQADAMAAVAQLRAMGRAGMAEHPCIGPERMELTMPGCAIFTAIQRKWPVPTLTVADRGLREGMLLRLMRDAAGHPV